MTLRICERNWFTLPREYRAMLVANEQLRGLQSQVEAWEERQKRNTK